jgi:uncharacterized membrane protein
VSELLNRLRQFLFGAPLPEDGGGTVTRWVQLADWTDTQNAIVAGLVLLVLIVSLWNLRRAATWKARFVLLTLRLSVIAILLFAFYQPALLEERRARSTNVILILADDSASMALPQGDSTRSRLLAEFVTAHEDLWRELEQTNLIESYVFGDSVDTAKWRDIGTKLQGRGQHTKIIETLEEMQDRYRNRDIGGIVLLSDGIDNGRLGRLSVGGGSLDSATQRMLRSFGAPIYTFGLTPGSIRDVAVKDLRYSPFAFKRNLTSLEAEIEVHGYATGRIEIELLEEGKLVRSVTHDVRPGRTSYTAVFEFTPVELGHRVYSVRVKPFPEEVTLENNERHAVIRVNRDKIRVLQIAGHPSWDVRFLRNHLRQTPNIQLISFFILIRQGQGRSFRPGETSLIPFPAQQLFVEELGGFDLVILQDFNYGPFNTDQHLFRIRDYVDAGGALAMVGGRLSFGSGNWDGTELETALPVDMKIPSGEPSSALDFRPYKPRLSETGKTHSITRLSFDSLENESIWSEMPELYGANLLDGLKKDALVLLEHPNLKMQDGKPMPILAIGETKKGRVATIASDSFWRFKMTASGVGGDTTYYDKVWANLIRWLVQDPDLDLIRVTPSSGVRSLGESVDLDIRAFGPDYRPQADTRMELAVRRRGDEGAEPQAELVFQRGDLVTDDAGRCAVQYAPSRAGIYDVVVKGIVSGRQISAHTVFVVSDERPEMRQVIANSSVLQQLAQVTEGRAFSLTVRDPVLRFNPPRVSDVTSRRYHERWNVPMVFFLACILMTLEWWYRRRVGFL